MDLVQRLKLIGNIYVASLRRPAQFGGIPSSRAEDIKDYNLSYMALYTYTQNLSFTVGKTLIFKPVVCVGVWFWVNDICLFCGPLCYLPGHIFRFFVSCAGPEEIVPESTRGKRQRTKIKIKKNRQKKKKSGNLMKRAQKNFERDRRKIFFLRAKS